MGAGDGGVHTVWKILQHILMQLVTSQKKERKRKNVSELITLSLGLG